LQHPEQKDRDGKDSKYDAKSDDAKSATLPLLLAENAFRDKEVVLPAAPWHLTKLQQNAFDVAIKQIRLPLGDEYISELTLNSVSDRLR
jgi:hypothetical protein